MVDLQLTQSDKAGLGTSIGANPSYVYMNTTAAPLAVDASVTIVQTPGDRSGMSMAAVINTSSYTTAIPYVFTLPFLSGVVGVNCSKMLPLGKLHNPIHIEIYWANNDDAIYYGTGGAGAVWTISNVEFCACYVELEMDDHDEPGIPHYISTHTFRQASTYLPSGTTGEFTTLVPFRCASLNSIYARFRNQTTAVQGANATPGYRKGSSINPNISYFYFRIGSSVYPNKPIYCLNGTIVGTGGEPFAELLKSMHSFSTLVGNTAINPNQYQVIAGPTAAIGGIQGWNQPFVPGAKNNGAQDTHNNAFAIGLELQTFANRNDTILSGISTMNAQMFFTMGIYSGAQAGGQPAYNYTIDFFANMDMILIIQDGIMSAKF